ncbi:hypothetical protein V8E52_009894 [Russula decolorans]
MLSTLYLILVFDLCELTFMNDGAIGAFNFSHQGARCKFDGRKAPGNSHGKNLFAAQHTRVDTQAGVTYATTGRRRSARLFLSSTALMSFVQPQSDS